MKIEELSREQIERAKALETNEERLDYLKECGVELDEDMLADVSGGGITDADWKPGSCPARKGGKVHEWKKTGKTRKGRFLGLIDDVEYMCIYCRERRWNWC